MYPQILLLPEDREKIRILYKQNQIDPISEYQLDTIAYGIDCALWQAIRTVHQVAVDHGTTEDIKWIIKKYFYMDGLFHGGDSISECQSLIQSINYVLGKAKLPLTKWMSNHPEVLSQLEDAEKSNKLNMIHYVPSNENPADAALRGQLTIEFMTNTSFRMQGPSWLKDDQLPITPFETKCLTGMSRNCIQHTIEVDEKNIVEITERFSSFDRLIGSLTVILLWIQISKSKSKTKSTELYDLAKLKLFKSYQAETLGKEIKSISKGNNLPKGNWLIPLTPFIDTNGILRVGGRLWKSNSNDFHQQHPILVPNGYLDKLIIFDFHRKNGHSANSLTESLIKQFYWIPGLKRSIKYEIHKCKNCMRFRANTLQPQIGSLPVKRISPGYIFENTAVDFCGPFIIRPSKIKFENTIKAWVSVFVCMATKLCHLEPCLKLSIENFLSAFKRFCARRSFPSTLYSDNGSNVVRANRVLKEEIEKITKKGSNEWAVQGIKWRFIPPGSPHLICKIKAILNSLPLCPLSNDQNNEMSLTPGHFAAQRTLKAPVPTLTFQQQIPENQSHGCLSLYGL